MTILKNGDAEKESGEKLHVNPLKGLPRWLSGKNLPT